MKSDISSENDIKLLVDTFYSKVNNDDLLSPIFNDKAKVDWPHHLPTMYKFWGTQLIGTMDYKGQPFPPHMKLDLAGEHFNRWLELFTATVKELFEGPTAELAIYKAQNIAQIFQYKLGITKK
ncbi:MAG: sec-independent protein translocase TatC [Bacteroidota bacterium]|jgi:hemoglobin|nr:sec-independent protein translocase TatC [Bacteroidota bacterium]